MRQKQKHVVQVRGQVRWEFYQDSKSGRWIAICQPLALVLEADTHTELRENIEDSLRLFLRSVFADGQLAKFLKERGWVAGRIPSNVAAKDIRFDVPIELIAKAASDGHKRQLHK